jgi:hypothetical protein
VVVDDLDVVSAVRLPDKTDAPLVVHTNAVLTFALTLQRLEPVSWRDSQTSQLGSRMKLQQFSSCGSFDVPESSDRPTVEQSFGFGTGERANHA